MHLAVHDLDLRRARRSPRPTSRRRQRRRVGGQLRQPARHGAAAAHATLIAADRIEPALAEWTLERCSFPSSMVGRITPATTNDDRRWLRQVAGIDDSSPVVAEPFRH
jgi:hypothetical protein